MNYYIKCGLGVSSDIGSTYLTEPSSGNVYLYEKGGEAIDVIIKLIINKEIMPVGNTDYRIEDKDMIVSLPCGIGMKRSSMT